MQHRQRGRKRNGVYTQSYQNAKRARYSGSYRDQPPNMLIMGGNRGRGGYNRTHMQSSQRGGYRTMNVPYGARRSAPPRSAPPRSAPPRSAPPRKRPPPQRAPSQRKPPQRPPPQRPPTKKQTAQPPQRWPTKKQTAQPPQRWPTKKQIYHEEPTQRPPSQRKPPHRPPTKKLQNKGAVKVPLFENKGPLFPKASIPAKVPKPVSRKKPVSQQKKKPATQTKQKHPQQKKKAPAKRIPKKAPAKRIPKQATKMKAKAKPVQKKKPKPQKVLKKPPPKKKAQLQKKKPQPIKKQRKGVTKPKPKATQPKATKPTARAKSSINYVKAKTKTMKPKLDLLAEIKAVVRKVEKDDDLGWKIHPELVAPVNVTGKWRSFDQSGAGAFNLTQKGRILSGGTTSITAGCKITGQIDTKKRTINFVQEFQNAKKVTSVAVTGTVELTVIKTSFIYDDPDGGSPKTGNATLVQEPTGSMTGVWAPVKTPINFHLFHYPNGMVLGYLGAAQDCQVFGTLVNGKVRIQQEWVKKGSKVQCVGEFVGEDLFILMYGYYNSDGKLETGTTKFNRKKGKLPVPPKIWNVSYVKASNVQKEMKFTPQTALIKKTVVPASRKFTDNGNTEVVQNAEFCLKAGDITWHRERFTKQILTRPVPWGTKLTKHDNGSSHYPLYYPDMKMLILGEADFSFTLGLATALQGPQGSVRAKKSALPTIVGTSYLEKADVPRYITPPNFQDGPLKRTFINENSDVNINLLTITDLGAHVRFGVDARAIHETLRQGENAFCSPHALPRKFDRIIFPFPRASLKRTNWNAENQLLQGLLASSKKELTSNGEIHIILHNSKMGINQFDMWHIREVAESAGYVWRASLPFNFRLIPPYYPKDVASKQWTPFEAAIHVFTVKDGGWKVEKRLWRDPPSKEKVQIKSTKICPGGRKYAESKFEPE